MLYNFSYDNNKEKYYKSNSREPSRAEPSRAERFTLNFFQVYVYLLIIKAIIFIQNSYLKKLFIRLNISIYIFIKTINCYFAIFTYKVRLLFVCQNKLKFLFQGEKKCQKKTIFKYQIKLLQ